MEYTRFLEKEGVMKRKLFELLVLVLIIVGLCFIGNYERENFVTNQSQEETLSQLRNDY